MIERRPSTTPNHRSSGIGDRGNHSGHRAAGANPVGRKPMGSANSASPSAHLGGVENQSRGIRTCTGIFRCPDVWEHSLERSRARRSAGSAAGRFTRPAAPEPRGARHVRPGALARLAGTLASSPRGRTIRPSSRRRAASRSPRCCWSPAAPPPRSPRRSRAAARPTPPTARTSARSRRPRSPSSAGASAPRWPPRRRSRRSWCAPPRRSPPPKPPGGVADLQRKLGARRGRRLRPGHQEGAGRLAARLTA